MITELLFYNSLYQKSHNEAYLAEFKALLEDIDIDLKAKPRDFRLLRQFAEGARAEEPIDGAISKRWKQKSNSDGQG